MTVDRLLQTHMIPASLWDSDVSRLLLPPALAGAYRAALSDAGLVELSNQRNRDSPPIGGLTQQDTDKHFAQAFDGSVARVELAVIDPNNDVTAISDAFIRSLSGNQLCLIDAPCGAGAATLSFLTTIAELREKGVLPRQPLEVLLVGAELSEPARRRAAEMIQRVNDFLESQAIFLTHDFLEWDVTSAVSNANLVRRMVVNSDAVAKTLLVIANFNGFLEHSGNKKSAQPQLSELFRFAAENAKQNLAIWIEPDMNRVVNESGLFGWVAKCCSTIWRLFVKSDTENEMATATLRFADPVDPTQSPRVGLAVLQLQLEPQR